MASRSPSLAISLRITASRRFTNTTDSLRSAVDHISTLYISNRQADSRLLYSAAPRLCNNLTKGYLPQDSTSDSPVLRLYTHIDLYPRKLYTQRNASFIPTFHHHLPSPPTPRQNDSQFPPTIPHHPRVHPANSHRTTHPLRPLRRFHNNMSHTRRALARSI